MKSPVVIDLTAISPAADCIKNGQHASMSTARKKKKRKQTKTAPSLQLQCDDKNEGKKCPRQIHDRSSGTSSSIFSDSTFKFTRNKTKSPIIKKKSKKAEEECIEHSLRSDEFSTSPSKEKRKGVNIILDLCNDDESEHGNHQISHNECDKSYFSSSLCDDHTTTTSKTSKETEEVEFDSNEDTYASSIKKKRIYQEDNLDACNNNNNIESEDDNLLQSSHVTYNEKNHFDSSFFDPGSTGKKTMLSPTINMNDVAINKEISSTKSSSNDVKMKSSSMVQTDLFGNILKESKSNNNYKRSNNNISQTKISEFTKNVKKNVNYKIEDDGMKNKNISNTHSSTTIVTKSTTSITSTYTFEQLLDKAHTIMREKFKLSSLRLLQPIALESALRGQHQIIVMATGGGKSLCYQLPGCVLPGLTIVISPLISLMLDQVRSLTMKGIPAAVLSSSAGTKEENSKILLKILDYDRFLKQQQQQNINKKNKNKEIIDSSLPPKFLYVTPELINANSKVRSVLIDIYKKNIRGGIALLAIDESHCLSTWGHEFRPAYRSGLSWLRQTFPNVPCIACTATATPKVIEDIRDVLNFSKNDVPCHLGSFNRPNIFFEVRYKDMLDIVHPRGSIGDLTDVIKEQHESCAEAGEPCSGIVYVHKRSDADTLAQRISKESGIRAAPYHAGLSDKDRNETHKNWSNGTIDVAVATVAFGMGIDLPHVRYVLHWCMSKSVEGFYQESGRAGRDTKQALSILYYSKSDADKFTFLIRSNLERKQLNSISNNESATSSSSSKSRSEADASKSMESIQKMIAYCTDACCRRRMILQHFGEMTSAAAATQDICKRTCDYCSDPKKFEEAINFLSSSNDRNGYPQFSKNSSKMNNSNNHNTHNVGFVKAGTLKKIMHKQRSSRSGAGGGFIKASKLKL